MPYVVESVGRECLLVFLYDGSFLVSALLCLCFVFDAYDLYVFMATGVLALPGVDKSEICVTLVKSPDESNEPRLGVILDTDISFVLELKDTIDFPLF